MASLFTISNEVSAELKEKSSRFLAFAYPIQNREAIEEKLKEVKKSYSDSRHVCYGWRLGAMGQSSKAYDAGEPAHSAGTPILNEIRSRELSDILVVVIRYFGGTKLGIPGLIEAYGAVSAAALKKANFIEIKDWAPISIRFPYSKTIEVRTFLHHHPPLQIQEEFEADCYFTLWYEREKIGTLKENFEDFGILDENSTQ